MAAENDPEQSAKSIAGLLELLRSERELTDDREILSRSDPADVQVVESAESAQELYLAGFHGCLGKLEAAAASHHREPAATFRSTKNTTACKENSPP